MSGYILFAGAMANVIGTLPYIRQTIQGTTKPNRVTWFLWGLAPLIGGAIELTSHVGWVAFPVFVSGILSALVFISSFANKNAYWRLGSFDYLCGAFSVAALVAWLALNQSALAIACAILSDLFASLPTVRKSWTHPESESTGTYIGGLCNALSAFLATSQWTFSSLAFPGYIVVQEIILLSALYKKKLLS
jgi:hypothetical protein